MKLKGNYQMTVQGKNMAFLDVRTNSNLNLLFIEVDGKTVELDWWQSVTLVKDLRVFISKLEKPVKREGGNQDA